MFPWKRSSLWWQHAGDSLADVCLVVKGYGCNPSKMLWANFLWSCTMQSIHICSVPVYRYITPFKRPHTTPRESYDGRDSDTIGNVRRWLWWHLEVVQWGAQLVSHILCTTFGGLAIIVNMVILSTRRLPCLRTALRSQWLWQVYFSIRDWLYMTTWEATGPDHLTVSLTIMGSCHLNVHGIMWFLHSSF